MRVCYSLCADKSTKVTLWTMYARNAKSERKISCRYSWIYLWKTIKFREKVLSNSGVIHLWISMTKYLCFQYSVCPELNVVMTKST